ncbi:MAG: hypothetical protein KAJ09_12450 [Deltaproteobacteria bacterium]|nr:hypothetical protein [Deltaproteobacteria bacterium]
MAKIGQGISRYLIKPSIGGILSTRSPFVRQIKPSRVARNEAVILTRQTNYDRDHR